jgi:hypothetical protein
MPSLRHSGPAIAEVIRDPIWNGCHIKMDSGFRQNDVSSGGFPLRLLGSSLLTSTTG